MRWLGDTRAPRASNCQEAVHPVEGASMPEAPPPVLAFAETTVEALLAAATSKLGDVGRSPEELERDVRQRVSDLIAQNEHMVQDPPSRQWLLRTSIVLAV